MKFSKYFMLAGVAAMLAACSSEDPEVNGPVQNEGGEPAGFIKVALGDLADETRAASDKSDPTSESNDSKIVSATFYFYDNAGSYLFSKTAGGSGADSELKEGNTAILELDDLNATQLAVIVNYDAKDDNVSEAKLTGGKYKEGDNYIMASSAYYGEGNAITYRAPIKKIYSKIADAQETGAEVTQIYVERVVAKLNMSTSITDLANINIENVNIANTGVEAHIKFIPEHVFLTNTNKNSWVRKRLKNFSDYADDTWFQGKIKGENRSYWTAGCLATETEADLNKYSYNDKSKAPVWKANTDYITEYAYDHVGNTDARCTSLIVTGRYEFASTDGLNLTGEGTDGTFWIVAMNGKFNAYDNEADAIKVMSVDGSTKDKDGKDRKLTQVANKPWLYELSDKSSPVTCMIFKSSHGYYSAPITRFVNGKKEYNAIVRNHIYNVDVNEIKGLGIGIPDLTWPIIPVDQLDPASEKAYFNVSVNVVDWEVVAQNVKW